MNATVVEIDAGAAAWYQEIWEQANPGLPWPGLQSDGAGGLYVVCSADAAARFVDATKRYWLS